MRAVSIAKMKIKWQRRLLSECCNANSKGVIAVLQAVGFTRFSFKRCVLYACEYMCVRMYFRLNAEINFPSRLIWNDSEKWPHYLITVRLVFSHTAECCWWCRYWFNGDGEWQAIVVANSHLNNIFIPYNTLSIHTYTDRN